LSLLCPLHLLRLYSYTLTYPTVLTIVHLDGTSILSLYTRTKLKAFLIQVELYIGFNMAKFATDRGKVPWVASFLSGPAFNWIEVFIIDHMQNITTPEERDDETIAIVDDFGSFKRKISRVFVDIDAERTAERHLQNLRQLKSAATYAAEFQQHAGRTAQFYRGLKDSVKDDICRGERPSELQAMIRAMAREVRTVRRSPRKETG
jgi:hypothetical protein